MPLPSLPGRAPPPGQGVVGDRAAPGRPSRCRQLRAGRARAAAHPGAARRWLEWHPHRPGRRRWHPRPSAGWGSGRVGGARGSSPTPCSASRRDRHRAGALHGAQRRLARPRPLSWSRPVVLRHRCVQRAGRRQLVPALPVPAAVPRRGPGRQRRHRRVAVRTPAAARRDEAGRRTGARRLLVWCP